ncbi:MAG: four helix bundle protein [Nanoarchaeota archaeon]|nr:four helix bundle protein [Nanoarchaeota archaeon]
MTEIQNTKQYDLEERTYKYAKENRDFVKQLPKSVANYEYGKQLIRASGSQAANYIEANEALSKKDFVHRIKICRKETKECSLWIKLCDTGESEALSNKQQELLAEGQELRKIFTSILNKSL